MLAHKTLLSHKMGKENRHPTLCGVISVCSNWVLLLTGLKVIGKKVLPLVFSCLSKHWQIMQFWCISKKKELKPIFSLT